MLKKIKKGRECFFQKEILSRRKESINVEKNTEDMQKNSMRK